MRARARRPSPLDRMPLVASVLEMLWAVQPSLEVDLHRWGTWKQGRSAAVVPPVRSAAGDDARSGGAAGAAVHGGESRDPGAAAPHEEQQARADGRGGAGGASRGAGRRPAGWNTRRRRQTRHTRPSPGAAPSPAIDPALRRCYLELEVQVGSRLEVVRSAWRRLVREHHPDRHAGDPERQRRGTERLKEINRSYGRLKRWLGQGG